MDRTRIYGQIGHTVCYLGCDFGHQPSSSVGDTLGEAVDGKQSIILVDGLVEFTHDSRINHPSIRESE